MLDDDHVPIVVEDEPMIVADDSHPSKRLRSVKYSAGMSEDAQIALCLQMAEFGCTSVASLDAIFAQHLPGTNTTDVLDAGKPEPQVISASQPLPLVRVKLYVSDKKSIVVQVNPYAKLASIFSSPAVAKMLRGFVGAGQASTVHMADHFAIHCSLPKTCVFDKALAERISIIDAVGVHGGVLRIQVKGSLDDKSTRGSRAGNGTKGANGNLEGAKVAGGRKHAVALMARTAGECDGVEVLRFRTPDGCLGSPVVLVKNFNRDRGVLLARLTGLKKMVEMAPEARKTINNNVRDELDSHKKTRQTFTTEVRRASDRVLDIAEEAIKNDTQAKAALAHRTEYASTAVLVYDSGTTLPRHVDGCGHWVVLLSFGLTVDFFAAERGFKFESGDALVFNGSKQHAVMHGIDHVHEKASLTGRTCQLPEELNYLSHTRASFQARQGDP